MPYFEITDKDGKSTRVAYALSRLELILFGLAESEKGGTVQHVRTCVQCKKAGSTVYNTLCEACWQQALNTGRTTWADLHMSEEELKQLVLSFFVQE